MISNLALQLSRMGRTVILLDLDLGAANLHTFLGIKNNKEGLGYLIHRKNVSLESMVYPTEYKQLFFIPGDNLLPETANFPYYIKKKLLQEIQNLTADYIFLDLGAGSSFNTLDFFNVSSEPIVVLCPEPTSILNAYSFIKSARARQIFSLFPGRSPQRNHLKNLLGQKMEGTDWNFSTALSRFSLKFPNEAHMLEKELLSFKPRILINMGRSRNDLKMTGHLRSMCKKNLSVELRYIGFIHFEESMHLSVKRRKPFIIDYPDSVFGIDILRLAEGIESLRARGKTTGFPTDLQELEKFI